MELPLGFYALDNTHPQALVRTGALTALLGPAAIGRTRAMIGLAYRASVQGLRVLLIAPDTASFLRAATFSGVDLVRTGVVTYETKDFSEMLNTISQARQQFDLVLVEDFGSMSEHRTETLPPVGERARVIKQLSLMARGVRFDEWGTAQEQHADESLAIVIDQRIRRQGRGRGKKAAAAVPSSLQTADVVVQMSALDAAEVVHDRAVA